MKLDRQVKTAYGAKKVSVAKTQIHVTADGRVQTRTAFYIPLELKQQFRAICHQADISPSEMLRGFVSDFVSTRGKLVIKE